MKKLLLVLPLLAGLVLVGCDTTPDYYPLTVGSVWNYTGYTTMSTSLASTDTMVKLDQRVQITKSDTLNSGLKVVEVVTTITQDMAMPDTTITSVDTSYYAETDSSVVAYSDKADTTAALVVRLPFEAGKSWTVGGLTTTVVEQEDVTVPAGTYKKAWRLETSAAGVATGKAWHANKTGLVKYTMTHTVGGVTYNTVVELKSATVK